MRLGPLELDVSPGWTDTTQLAQDEFGSDAPLTLTGPHPNGGVLQFSLALHQSGPRPNPSDSELCEILSDWGNERGLPLSSPRALASERRIATADYADDEFRGRAWVVSDQGSFVFATYFATRDHDMLADETTACDAMLASLRLAP